MEFSEKIKKGFIYLNKDVIVTDPCYYLDKDSGIILNNVLPGKYMCFFDKAEDEIFDKDFRIKALYLYHENYLDIEATKRLKHFSVDSGISGVYNLDFLKEKHKISNRLATDESFKLSVVKVDNPNYKEFDMNDDYVRMSKYIIEKRKAYRDILGENVLENIISGDIIPDESLEGRLEFSARMTYFNDSDNQKTIQIFDANSYEGQAFVTSGGYGDGSYPLYVGYNEKGEIVSLRLSYMQDEDEEEDDGFCEEYE